MFIRATKLLAVIMPLVLLSSCYNENNRIYKKLQGDWVNTSLQKSLCFHDTTCSYIDQIGGEFSKFYIKDDTICCYPKRYEYNQNKIIKFPILYLSKKILRVESTYDSKKKDTLELYRHENKLGNLVVIDSIKINTIDAGLLISRMPELDLEIYNDGRVLFRGRNHTKKIGNYKGTLTKEQLDFLNEKFRCVEYRYIYHAFGLLCSGYAADIEIYIRNTVNNYKKKFILTQNITSWEDLDFQIFINYVLNIYEHVDLKPYNGKIRSPWVDD